MLGWGELGSRLCPMPHALLPCCIPILFGVAFFPHRDCVSRPLTLLKCG